MIDAAQSALLENLGLEWRIGIRPGPLYPRAGAQPGLRFTGAHNNRS
jgi:hypothetical protein